ncbi:Spx/MgsR family RNA polymerase-binding regulatory protein [Oceanobacillus sp. 143]|uniref:Transcriptional regulator Spx n=1 Tax=Oceanobacillus zhaokaii TaxID=2052660 RepID=A0A345PCN3_9BACI|nr:transcriptional regulator Spx [Oceanobacillus zhaokaii]AXI07763.1 transcriptional regulator Spx [Oceanobacillus zhaokaii]QGS67906.1 Spx/MgsR family RNA polymerase-binding regulatory protein [Oceanobacillus sp. 143]
MLKLYIKPGCTSCRKAKKWLEANGIAFVERNIFTKSLTLSEIMEIFRLTDNGTDDVISMRSRVAKNKIADMNQLSLKELYNFIQENPSILKSPIIHDEKRLMVGYNEHQIRRFIPKSVRLLYLHEAQKII